MTQKFDLQPVDGFDLQPVQAFDLQPLEEPKTKSAWATLTDVKPTLRAIWEGLNRPAVPIGQIAETLTSKARPGAMVRIPFGPGGPWIPAKETTVAGMLQGGARALEEFSVPSSAAMMAGIGILTSVGLPGFALATGLSGKMAYDAWLQWIEADKARLEGREVEAVAGKTAAVLYGVMSVLPFLHRGTPPGRRAAAISAIREGIESPQMDPEGLAQIREWIRGHKKISPEEKTSLLALVDKRADRMRKAGPLVAPVPTRPETPLPGAQAGAAPGALPIRTQMGIGTQMPLGAPASPQAAAQAAAPPNLPAGTAPHAVQPSPEPRLPGLPRSPVKYDPAAPISDIQRRAVFAIAGDRGIPSQVVEIVAGKRLSSLNAGEAQVLMGRLRELTPADIKSLTPITPKPLLEQPPPKPPAAAPAPAAPAVSPPAAPQPLKPAATSKRARNYDPEVSLENAILSLGGISAEKVRKAGTWTEWSELPTSVKIRVFRKDSRSGPDDVASQLAGLGYGWIESENDLLAALKGPRGKTRKQMELENQIDQAQAHLEKLNEEIRAAEEVRKGAPPEENIPFDIEDIRAAGEQGPVIREPGEEGWARFRDERTKNMFEPEFMLRGATAPRREQVSTAAPKVQATGRPQQLGMLEGPLFERAAEQKPKELPPPEPSEPKLPEPFKTVVKPSASKAEEIKRLEGAIADGEMRLRSKVNALGEKLTPGELEATKKAVEFARERVGELGQPSTPPAGGPFTSRDIDAFNRFTNYETDLARANAEFASESAQYRQEAIDRLKRYGINEIPEDVNQALRKLNGAIVNQRREFARARGIAPGAYIVGPSNYLKHARPERARAIEAKAVDTFNAAKEYLDKAIRRHSPNAPISADKAEAPDLLQAKIDKAEKNQELYRQINAIVRKKDLTKEQKVDKIAALGMSRETAAKTLEKDYAGRVGIPDYQLRNNLANINRMRDRLAQLETTRSIPASETPFKGGKVLDNADENRIQLVFDEKPDPAMIARLKSHGFKWAPSQGAWQRQRTENARYAVHTVLGDRWLDSESRAAFLHPKPAAAEIPKPAEPPPESLKTTLEEDAPGIIHHLPEEIAGPLSNALMKVQKPTERPRPVSEAATQFAQAEVDRRALVARETVMKVINGKGTWSDKRKQLGLESGSRYFDKYPDVPISKTEIQNIIDRELADTVRTTGLTPTAPAQPSAAKPGSKPTTRSLFGDESGFIRFRDRGFIDDDPAIKRIFDRLEEAERNAKQPPLRRLPRPGETDIPGEWKTGVGNMRSLNRFLLANEKGAPVAQEIMWAAWDRKRDMQRYYDLGTEILKGSKGTSPLKGIKRRSQEAYAVFDLLDGKTTPEALKADPAFTGNADRAITAYRRLRSEIFEPIIQAIRSPELEKDIGKVGYIRSYAPHFIDSMKGMGGDKALWDMLPESFRSRFTKPRDWKEVDYERDIFTVLPVYINGMMKTLYDIPAYARALEHIEKIPEGDFRGLAKWYADNYIGQPTIRNPLDTNLMRRINNRIGTMYYDAFIGLNPQMALVNLTQTLTNTFPELGARYTGAGIKALLSKEGRKAFHESGILFDYPGLEEEFSRFNNPRKVLYYAFQKAEYVNRGIAYLGALEKAKAIGLKGRPAERFALDIVDSTNFTYGKEAPIAFLHQLPAASRTFKTFALKESDFISTLFANALKKGATDADRAKLVRFLAITVGVPVAAAAAGASSKDIRRYGLDPLDLLPKTAPVASDIARFGAYMFKLTAGTAKVSDMPEDVIRQIVKHLPAGLQLEKLLWPKGQKKSTSMRSLRELKSP